MIYLNGVLSYLLKISVETLCAKCTNIVYCVGRKEDGHGREVLESCS